MRKLTILLAPLLILALVICVIGCGGSGDEDSDGDGWTDSEEQKAGTNPHKVDTDGDGYWDPHDANPLDSSIPLQATTPTPSSTATGDKVVGRLIKQVLIGGQELVPLPPDTNTVPLLGQEIDIFVKCLPPAVPTELDYIRVKLSWPDGEKGEDWQVTTDDWEENFGPVLLDQEGLYDLTVIAG